MFCLTFSIRLFKSRVSAAVGPLFNLNAHCGTVPGQVKRIYIKQGNIALFVCLKSMCVPGKKNIRNTELLVVDLVDLPIILYFPYVCTDYVTYFIESGVH